jgi:hypothetical protein
MAKGPQRRKDDDAGRAQEAACITYGGGGEQLKKAPRCWKSCRLQGMFSISDRDRFFCLPDRSRLQSWA